jgi:hypothetical protein
MSSFILVVALAFGLVAAAQYAIALQRTHAPRRHYMMALTCGAVFVGCIGVLASREGPRVVAVIFLGLLLIGATLTHVRRRRYRAPAR